MSTPGISAVIMARNEERNIEAAIASLSFADQIVVADTGSSDNTLDLATAAGAEVYSIPFDGYGTSKNRALEFCRYSWVISIDADERVTPELATAILTAAKSDSPFDGYRICRLSYFLGQPIKHSGWYPDYILRLFKKDKGHFSQRLVHESVELDGSIGRLDGHLLHYSYPTLESYMEKLNIYTTMNARELYNNGHKGSHGKTLIHPMATFLKMFLLKAGFLDGARGFLLAVLSSYNVFVKYAKLRELSSSGDRE